MVIEITIELFLFMLITHNSSLTKHGRVKDDPHLLKKSLISFLLHRIFSGWQLTI